MNGPAKLVIFLACVACFVFAMFVFEVVLFRLSCRIAGIPKPSIGRSISIVLSAFMVVNAVEAVLGAIVREAYIAGDFPLWEAGLVAFFLSLPIHMAISSFVHSRMMNVSFTDAVAEWIVEKALKLTLIVFGIAGITLIIWLGAVLR